VARQLYNIHSFLKINFYAIGKKYVTTESIVDPKYRKPYDQY